MTLFVKYSAIDRVSKHLLSLAHCSVSERHNQTRLKLYYWVIPENIHTLPQAAAWNSEGEGVSWTGILKAWGYAVWKSKCMELGWGGGGGRGGFSSEFPEDEDGKIFA